MADSSKFLFLCEGPSDERILGTVLQSLGLKGRARILPTGTRDIPSALLSGKVEENGQKGQDRFNLTSAIKENPHRAVVAVFDLEFGSPLQPAPERAQIGDVWLAPAVPNLESWILSDSEVYEALSRTDSGNYRNTFDKYISNSGVHFINSKAKYHLGTKSIRNIYSSARAEMLSPSLRSFAGLLAYLGEGARPPTEFSLPAALLSNLLTEYYPPEAPIYRTLEGSTLSGKEMAREIVISSGLGRQYSSDLLRVCRDILARQAEKYQERGSRK